MPDEPNGVYISMRDVYDQMILLKDSVRDLTSSLPVYKQDIDDIKIVQADMETRMRSTEKWRYGLPIASILAILSLVITAFQTFGGK